MWFFSCWVDNGRPRNGTTGTSVLPRAGWSCQVASSQPQACPCKCQELWWVESLQILGDFSLPLLTFVLATSHYLSIHVDIEVHSWDQCYEFYGFNHNHHSFPRNKVPVNSGKWTEVRFSFVQLEHRNQTYHSSAIKWYKENTFWF